MIWLCRICRSTISSYRERGKEILSLYVRTDVIFDITMAAVR